jgi:hypothetical protein
MAYPGHAPQDFEPLRIYTFPFSGINVGVLVFFTLLFTWIESVTRGFGVSGLIIVMMLAYVATLLFFGYLFVILSETARGHQQVSKLSVNLLDDAKGPLFKEVILLSFLAALVFLIPHPFWKIATALSMLLVVPIATSIIVIRDQLFAAMNPLSWIDMISRIGTRGLLLEYLALQAALILVLYFSLTSDLGWLNFIKVAVVLTLFMLVFRALGVLLHTNADELELPVTHSERLAEEQQAEAEERRISDNVFKLHQLARSGQSGKAWKHLQEHLTAESYRTEASYYARIRGWDNPALAIRAGQDYISRLVERDEIRTAWDVLEFCFTANNNEYRLHKGATVFEMIDQGDTSLRKKILAHLLSNFETDFPKHPRTAEALLLAARIIAHDLDDFEQARTIMAKLRSGHPDILDDTKFTALEAVLSLE